MERLLIFGLGGQEILFIALIVLLLFGGRKIPELMKGLGKGVKSFKDGMNGVENDLNPDNNDKKLFSTFKSMQEANEKEMTFWDHLDELRKVFFRIAIAVILLACIAFLNKELLFDIVLAPQQSDFILYRFFNRLATDFSMPSLQVEDFHVELINIQLTSQFMIHMSTAFYAGLLLASPYIIYLLFGFISPALHEAERKTCLKIMIPGFFLFITGILLNYFVIFPLSFRFLATYQVSELVVNKISISSYISSFTMLSLLLGAAFEIPIIAYFLSKLGLITAPMLKQYRKYALVGILVIAAIITPTSDVFTLLLVSIPLYFLYELSIQVVGRSRKKK